jgi:hypothetical protein
MAIPQVQHGTIYVRTRLETAAFEAAWAEGQAMTETEAVAFALFYL